MESGNTDTADTAYSGNDAEPAKSSFILMEPLTSDFYENPHRKPLNGEMIKKQIII